MGSWPGNCVYVWRAAFIWTTDRTESSSPHPPSHLVARTALQVQHIHEAVQQVQLPLAQAGLARLHLLGLHIVRRQGQQVIELVVRSRETWKSRAEQHRLGVGQQALI